MGLCALGIVCFLLGDRMWEYVGLWLGGLFWILGGLLGVTAWVVWRRGER
jgi:hypothetical protein